MEDNFEIDKPIKSVKRGGSPSICNKKFIYYKEIYSYKKWNLMKHNNPIIHDNAFFMKTMIKKQPNVVYEWENPDNPNKTKGCKFSCIYNDFFII